MCFKTSFLTIFAYAAAFGQTQTAAKNYQDAKAAEFRSAHEARKTDKAGYMGQAFNFITDAVMADPKYMDTYVDIARKYIAAQSSSAYNPIYASVFDQLVQVGKARSKDQRFISLIEEVIDGYKKELALKGYVPGKPFLQTGQHHYHCNIPAWAGQIYRLLLFAYPPLNPQVKAWGKYTADVNINILKGCGGEGSDMPPNFRVAYPIYEAIGDVRGANFTGKMLGDELMESYIFGGVDYDSKDYENHPPGYRPLYEKAMSYYHGGGVTREQLRSTILRYLRRAEKEPNERASAELARKTLAETF